MIALNIAAITETTTEKEHRLKRQREADDEETAMNDLIFTRLPKIKQENEEWRLHRRFEAYTSKHAATALNSAVGIDQPETASERRKREDADFLESIRIDNNAPPLTTAQILDGRPLWKDVTVLRAEALAAKEREERERTEIVIAPTPDPEF